MDRKILRRVLLTAASVSNWAFSAGYIRELYTLMNNMEFVQLHGDIIVDGEDFTPLAELAAAGMNSFLVLLSAGVYAVISAVFILLSSVLLRLVAVRKKDTVAEEELKFARRTIAVSSVLAFASGILLSDISMTEYVFALSWQQPLFMWLVYYRGLKKRVSAEGLCNSKSFKKSN